LRLEHRVASAYHVLWFFREQCDCARAITLDVLLDEAHFVAKNVLMSVKGALEGAMFILRSCRRSANADGAPLTLGEARGGVVG
jgi:hypothetical protein